MSYTLIRRASGNFTVKNAGVWQRIQNLYINSAGTWKHVRRLWIKDTGVWRSISFEYQVYELTITGDESFGFDAYQALASQDGGTLTKPIDARIIVNPGVTVSSVNTAVPGIWFSVDPPAGSTITLQNLGSIYGAGGVGGQGGDGGANRSWVGEAGDPGTERRRRRRRRRVPDRVSSVAGMDCEQLICRRRRRRCG
ncbi:MAG: hypothetical protein ACYS7Y_29145 [Planctomycetota bacterium]